MEKPQIVKKSMEFPRANPCTQVVVFDKQTRKFVSITVGGVEGRDQYINGVINAEAKILLGNNFRFPLRFNSSSKNFAFGQECKCRNSSWLRKGLIFYFILFFIPYRNSTLV